MTRPIAPVWRYAVNRSRKAARLTAEVRRLRHDLAVVRAERDALAAHWTLAVDQRDRARDVAVAMSEPACGPTDAEYDEFLRSLGTGPA